MNRVNRLYGIVRGPGLPACPVLARNASPEDAWRVNPHLPPSPDPGVGGIVLSQIVERDVKAVHGDVHALLEAGVIDRTEVGLVVFPYDAVHVDFMLKAA